MTVFHLDNTNFKRKDFVASLVSRHSVVCCAPGTEWLSQIAPGDIILAHYSDLIATFPEDNVFDSRLFKGVIPICYGGGAVSNPSFVRVDRTPKEPQLLDLSALIEVRAGGVRAVCDCGQTPGVTAMRFDSGSSYEPSIRKILEEFSHPRAEFLPLIQFCENSSNRTSPLNFLAQILPASLRWHGLGPTDTASISTLRNLNPFPWLIASYGGIGKLVPVIRDAANDFWQSSGEAHGARRGSGGYKNLIEELVNERQIRRAHWQDLLVHRSRKDVLRTRFVIFDDRPPEVLKLSVGEAAATVGGTVDECITKENWKGLVDQRGPDALDVVFVDNFFFNGVVPVTYGIDVVLPAESRRKHVKAFPLFIATTSSGGLEFRDRAYACGADSFLPKTDDILSDKVIEAIADALAYRDWRIDHHRARPEPPNSPEVERPKAISDEEWRYHWAKLFSDDPDIIKVKWVRTPKEGLSGARLYLIRPHKEAGDLAHRFVKLGPKSELVMEKFNYDKFIAGNIDNYCGRIVTPVSVGTEWAGLAYSGVGTNADYGASPPIAFREYASEMSSQQVNSGLRFILDDLLERLHTQRDSGQTSKWHARRLRAMFPRVKVAIEKMGNSREMELVKTDGSSVKLVCRQDDEFGGYAFELEDAELASDVFCRPGKSITAPFLPFSAGVKFSDVEGVRKDLVGQFSGAIEEAVGIFSRLGGSRNSLPNPKAVLGLEMDRCPIGAFLLEDKLLQEELSQNLTVGVIHGDLNLENVICTRGRRSQDSTHFWLIDFALTGFGAVASDFVKLEYELRRHLAVGGIFNLVMNCGSSPDSFEKGIRWAQKAEQHLCASFPPNANSDWAVPWNGRPKLDKAFLAIAQVRKIASERLRRKGACVHLAEMEYLSVLYYFGLAALKYKSEVSESLDWRGLPRIFNYVMLAEALDRLRRVRRMHEGKEQCETGGEC